MSDFILWHAEEERCKKQIKKYAPNHPVLDMIFPSTYEACKEYWNVLDEIIDKKGETE